MDSKTQTQIVEELEKTIAHAQQALTLLRKSADGPYDKLGDVAHRHLLFLEQHDGVMTLKDSRVIRREMFGTSVRSTANQFGKAGSGAMFYRDAPYGTAIKPSQTLQLTDAGKARALAYRTAHGLAQG